MKSSKDFQQKFYHFETKKQRPSSQLVITKQSKEQNDQNEITKYPQIEPLTFITLNQNIVNYKIGSMNELELKKKKNELQCSPTMSQLEYKQKKIDTKRSISNKIYCESIQKKQKEFILLIFCSMIFLCCLTFQVTQYKQNYSPEVKGLF